MNKERNSQNPSQGSGAQFTTKSEVITPSPFMVAANAPAAASAVFSERRPAEPTPAAAAPASYQPPTSFAFEQPIAEHAPFILDEVSSSPSQAALRAIFGVDHEMNIEEILQRLRSLPGIRHIAHVTSADVGVVDGLKKSLSALGFGSANIRIYGGNVPMEFVRHANTLLAVQTVSGFGPGVKEAIKIATQEIQRLS